MTEQQIKDLIKTIMGLDRNVSDYKFKKSLEGELAQFQSVGTNDAAAGSTYQAKPSGNWRDCVHKTIGENNKRKTNPREVQKAFHVRTAGESAKGDKP